MIMPLLFIELWELVLSKQSREEQAYNFNKDHKIIKAYNFFF